MKKLSKKVEVAAPKPKKSLKAKTLKPKRLRDTKVQLISLDERSEGDPLVSSRVFPETYYRRTPGTERASAMITILPGGTHVAWDTCGNCHAHISQCKCRDGISTSRSVEYLYDQTVAMKAGEDWNPNHRNYKGSIFYASRKARADAKRVFETRVHKPELLPSNRKPAVKKLTKPLKKPVAKPLPEEATDKAALDIAAKSIARDLKKQVAKKMGLSKPAPKKLAKKVKK